jgi:hypothetical protein
MSDIKVVTAEDIDQDLAGEQYVFRTVPPYPIEISPTFEAALRAFDAGERPAARAATDWLHNCALVQYLTSRTRLYLGQGRIAGYYSLASAHVALSADNRQALGLPDRRYAPATLMTWIAKDPRASISGQTLLDDAYTRAVAAAELQASAVFALDAADEDTATMWIERYGFQHLDESKGGRRLWIALDV